MRGLLLDTLSEVRDLKEKVTKQRVGECKPECESFLEKNEFPINSDEDFKNLELLLVSESEFMNGVRKYIPSSLNSFY